jgi:D-glycerate 3-kinase
VNLDTFIKAHQLPNDYQAYAQRWFAPLAKRLAQQLAHHRQQSNAPYIVGINGCQGSGKSTLTALLCHLLEAEGLSIANLSLDDVYLTHSERQALGQTVHPLLATRGVPGTHDIALALQTLDALTHTTGYTSLPRFDKSTDDRTPQASWSKAQLPVDLIILEGWCLGSIPEETADLATPINALESQEDPEGHWRQYVNQQLQAHYLPLWEQIDYWIMLKAPSFDCVFQWRLEQEDKLRLKLQQEGKSTTGLMNQDAIQRFIQHYERITRHTLQTLPSNAHEIFTLDEQRQITAHHLHH